jgi:hypothetical protein
MLSTTAPVKTTRILGLRCQATVQAVSHRLRNTVARIQCQVRSCHDLWRAKWYWNGFFNTSVSLASSHSTRTNFSTFTDHPITGDITVSILTAQLNYQLRLPMFQRNLVPVASNFCPEDGSSRFCQNISNHSRNYTMLHHRITVYSLPSISRMIKSRRM